MSTLTKILAVATLAVSGCSVFATPCEAHYHELCDICPKDDFNAALCKCLEEGEITADDGPENLWDDDYHRVFASLGRRRHIGRHHLATGHGHRKLGHVQPIGRSADRGLRVQRPGGKRETQ